ncbi:hypothetical protein BJ878DRAFT_537477 [Calycina marina]|uniref:NodB homology domain-containing protein n=1 Tax=Calycina marina TaxID=1763456 RepID=A0A9P8CJ99_9HELO|nr:hypothetical protein BJ878DRAFT_537477 [Calycina marina]
MLYQVGVPRLLNIFKEFGNTDKVSWFIPGYSMETLPAETKAIMGSGYEIGLHGYDHESAFQLSKQHQRDVLAKCISLPEVLSGTKSLGYRAPLMDMTPVRILPRVKDSNGYVDTRPIERMWKDSFEWLYENGCDGAGPSDFIFPTDLTSRHIGNGSYHWHDRTVSPLGTRTWR